jgi:hypothetical protein
MPFFALFLPPGSLGFFGFEGKWKKREIRVLGEMDGVVDLNLIWKEGEFDGVFLRF